jgi:hypothetical protein
MSQVQIPAVNVPDPITTVGASVASGVTTVIQAVSEAVEAHKAATKPVQTRKEKLTARATALHGIISKNTEEYNSILDTLKAISTIENVKVGDRASGTFGRADTARQVEGQVVGVNQTDTGISIKVLVGTGFDTDVLVLNESNITAIIPA